LYFSILNECHSSYLFVNLCLKSKSYQHSVFYIQEYIEKPSRDIRAFVINNETVCAIFRKSSHWITNTARGGSGEICTVTPEINDLCVRVAKAVGGGILAVDLVEHPQKGLQVIEVNHTMEFHTTVPLTGVDFPNLIVDYLLDVAKGQRDTFAEHTFSSDRYCSSGYCYMPTESTMK